MVTLRLYKENGKMETTIIHKDYVGVGLYRVSFRA